MTIAPRIQEHEEGPVSGAGNKPLSLYYSYIIKGI